MRQTIHKPLNTGQLAVLQALYTFRFASSEQLAIYFHRKHKTHIKKQLHTLEEQGYIAKRYDKSYKLKGKPAAYYLRAKGARILQEKTQMVDERVMKSLYRNKSISEATINHYMSVLRVYLHIRKNLPENFAFLTGTQLLSYIYLPTWRPDGFLGLPGNAYYFLDVFDETKPFFVSVRKTRNYLNYAASKAWPAEQAPFPRLLIVCDTQKNEIRLKRQIQKALNESLENAAYLTTTLDDLTSTSSRVWHDLQEHTISLTEP